MVDFKPKSESSLSLLRLSAAVLGRLVGLEPDSDLGRLVAGDAPLGILRLDGLVSVWQGSER